MQRNTSQRRRLLAALLICTTPALATAQMRIPPTSSQAEEPSTRVPFPKEMPAFGKERPLPIMNLQRTHLSNGMELWVLPRNGIPRVDATLVFRNAGQSADTLPGFSSFMSSVMTTGTQKREQLAIAQAAQAIGGRIDAFSNEDGMGVGGSSIRSKAPELFQLIAEVARTPAFSDKEITLAKELTLQGIAASKSMPGYESGYELIRVLLGNHPYARSQPTEASTQAITPELLRSAHAQRFRPERGLLIVTGTIGMAEAQRLAEAAFGDWKATGNPAPLPPMARLQAPPRKIMINRSQSVQSTLFVGSPAPPANSPDAVALKLATEVLGNGTTSRLFWKLREQKGYTYGASASVQNLRFGGYQFSRSAVRNEVTGAALADLLGELRRMGKEPVPADELNAVKRNIVGYYILSNQLQGSVASNLATNWLMGLPASYMVDYVTRVQTVSAEDVRKASARWFDPAKQTILIEGDASVVSKQLKPIGTFEIRQGGSAQ